MPYFNLCPISAPFILKNSSKAIVPAMHGNGSISAPFACLWPPFAPRQYYANYGFIHGYGTNKVWLNNNPFMNISRIILMFPPYGSINGVNFQDLLCWCYPSTSRCWTWTN